MIGREGPSDIRSMTNELLQLLLENADYAVLLRAYERARTEAVSLAEADAAGEGGGWSPRRAELPGIDNACLAPMPDALARVVGVHIRHARLYAGRASIG